MIWQNISRAIKNSEPANTTSTILSKKVFKKDIDLYTYVFIVVYRNEKLEY